MDEPFIVDARQEYVKRMIERRRNGESVPSDYEIGAISVGMEIETTRRALESIGESALDSHVTDHVAATLRDLLNRVGILDDVLVEYDALIVSRTAVADEHASEPQGSAVSSVADAVRRTELFAAASDQAPTPPASQGDDVPPAGGSGPSMRVRIEATGEASEVEGLLGALGRKLRG